MKLCKETKKDLLDLAREKDIYLEGNILKVIDLDNEDVEFIDYVKEATSRDKSVRKKRLEITKHIQIQYNELTKVNSENEKLMSDLKISLKETESDKKQIEEKNKELTDWKEENERISIELKNALDDAENAKKEAIKAKDVAENDLDILQKKTQFELTNRIVKVALSVIIGVGIMVTAVLIFSMFNPNPQFQTNLIASTWTNLVSILVTNCFSIVGTILGVKYAKNDSNVIKK